jgi:hypothetical protein
VIFGMNHGVGQRWTIRDRPQWDIEQIVLDSRECLRVTVHRSLIGYAYSPAELARMLADRGLDIADLVELDPE